MSTKTMAQIQAGLLRLAERAEKVQQQKEIKDIKNKDIKILREEKSISEIVNTDEWFLKAIKEWKCYPGALTNKCKQYTVDEVRAAIKWVNIYYGARSKAAVLWTELKECLRYQYENPNLIKD